MFVFVPLLYNVHVLRLYCNGLTYDETHKIVEYEKQLLDSSSDFKYSNKQKTEQL